MYEGFGKMRRGETIGLCLFAAAALLAFLRPLYANLLPGMKPAYGFLFCGLWMLFLKDETGAPVLTWRHAEKHVMWGMMFLFSSGMALGKLLTETGAIKRLAACIAEWRLDGGLFTLTVFRAFTTCLAELSSNTAAASIAIPVLISICRAIGLDPLPYVLISIVAANCAYILPVTTRAIPVSYGLDAGTQIRLGIRLSLLNILLTTLIGYFCLQFYPSFANI